MPIYEYSCKEHGVFEAVHKMNERMINCPQCIEEKKLEYTCEACKAVFIHEEGITYCIYCTQHELGSPVFAKPDRLISKTSFQLVGGGWARDNYGK
jgi:hypothetical protein